VHCRRTGRHGRIRDENRPVIQEECVSECGFNAHIGGNSREKQKPDASFLQLRVQRRVRETAVPGLHNHQVFGPRLQLIDDLEIPAAHRHQFAFQLRTAVHHPDS